MIIVCNRSHYIGLTLPRAAHLLLDSGAALVLHVAGARDLHLEFVRRPDGGVPRAAEPEPPRWPP